VKPILQVLPTPDALVRAAGDAFVQAASEAVGASGRFTVALSGGSTPKALYAALATDPALRAGVPWTQCEFFWGDERHVPPDDVASNYRMANEAMLAHAPVGPAQVHRIKGEYADADRAAAEYQAELQRVFRLGPGEIPRFDLILLGLGPDGHTASLFPATAGLAEPARLVVANRVNQLNTERITLTLPVLNNAARVIFLVEGPGKAAILKRVLEPAPGAELLPAQRVQPRDGTLTWLVDQAAAGGRQSASA
jgi:6-phosphogluconolactonase